MKEKVLIVEDQYIEADYLRQMLLSSDYDVCTLAKSVVQAEEVLEKEKPTFVLLDIFLKGQETGIDFARKLQQRNMPFVYLSANSNEEVLTLAKATHPYGFLVKPFQIKDLLVTMEIASYRHKHSIESNSIRDTAIRQAISDLFNCPDDLASQLEKLPCIVQQFIPFDFITIEYFDPDNHKDASIRMLRIAYNEYQLISETALKNIISPKQIELTKIQDEIPFPDAAGIYIDEQFECLVNESPAKRIFASIFDLQAGLFLPLTVGQRRFRIWFYSKRSNAYNKDILQHSTTVRTSLESGIALSILQTKELPATSKTTTFLPNTTDTFNSIVGKSHHMLNIFDLVQIVAPSDTAALILGESGTGKEKIADCIHQMSPRRNQTFIKVNCAALPASLIESELFGHEKGAFTGAYDKRIGKFEQADKGTIFLDEIGELPVEFQAKLLRVLQEKVIERIGSNTPNKIDVRIIAATNKNLEKEVAEGRFRLDLYYRLNVFPLHLPALRDRREDIPDLTAHFIAAYNTKTGRKIQAFSPQALSKLMAYDWPGNIRELENLVERNVLISKTPVIEDVNLPGVSKPGMDHETQIPDSIKSIQENERDHILAVLAKCNGRIWGVGAAADLLRIPPSTLKSKMKKLGIEKRFSA